MFCPKCGSENINTSRFCKKCGKPLPDASQIRQAAPPQVTYAVPQTATLLGQTLDGKYRIDAKLGSGGMGDVYRAMRLLIGDSVAIKTLHAHLANDSQAAERFRREAVTATQLKHRNIVAIYDVGISSVHNIPYILMELADGFSLRELIRRHRILPLDFVVTVTVQVCAALEEAHRLGIVHRDIKPENIVAHQTATGWHVKVLDFGIAKLYNQADIGLTLDGSAMGTPQYMSPEQCLGEPLDGRSDIYSVGILIYEMLAGTVPFKSPTASAIAVQQVQMPPIPPRSLNPNIPPSIEEVVLRALDKRREMRPPTASHLSQELIQAATVAFKSGLAAISETPLEMPEAAREFNAGQISEIRQTPPSHTLSSEILVAGEPAAKTPAEVIKPEAREIFENSEPLEKSEKVEISAESKAEETKSGGAEELAGADLSRVFEDAEHILDEILLDGKDKTAALEEKPASGWKKDSPIVRPGEELEGFDDSSPEVFAKYQAETVLPPEIPAGKPEENTSVETVVSPVAKPVSAPEIEPEPGSKKPFVIGAAAFLVVLALGGIIGFWLLSGSKIVEPTANNNTAVKPSPPVGMALVAGGSFTMGGDEQLYGKEKFTSPPHQVSVKPFFMDIYEVTCEEYKKFIDATGYLPPKNWNGKSYPPGTAKFPVTNVNWDAANAYAKWAGKRLPTEAEWEFAARGTDGRLYSWGSKWQDGMANANNVKKGLVEVGTFKGASPFGIYDLIGNAWEWTSTTLEPYPGGTLPTIEAGREIKIIRGGGWQSDTENATATRRGFYGARDEVTYGYENMSFRCVKDVTENQ